MAEWNPDMSAAPRGDKYGGPRILAVVDGEVHVIAFGKASHIGWHDWCLADQGPENFDPCTPTAWQPIPLPPPPGKEKET